MAKAKKSDTSGKAKKPSAPKKTVSGEEKALATATAQVEKLRGTVEKLERKLEKSKDKSAQWKTEARKARTKVAKLEAKLRGATRDAPVDHLPPAERGDLPVEDAPVASPAGPDESWTVARLRTVARERQVVGASRMTKAALLEALRA